MADIGKWFKLWASALDDPDLDNLDIADFGRWAKFGTHLKEQGKEGEITLTEPSRSLLAKLQLNDFNALILCIKKFPHVTVSTETNGTVSCNVKWQNWHKYQGDFSTNRVRKFRAKNDKMKRSKRRRDETRREENKTLTLLPTKEEVIFYCKERGNIVDPHTWFDFYSAKDWMIGKNKMKDWKACVRTWEKNKQGGSLADQYTEL